MNLLEALEGCVGEELASAALRWLLLHSLPTRLAVLDALSAESTIGPLVTSSIFSCHTEFFTADEELGAGRLDLVLEIDGALVGIESKFHATFQANQPVKYLSTLSAAAEALSRARPELVVPCLFVLAPGSRAEEIRAQLEPSIHCSFVSWETLLDAGARSLVDSDETTQAVFRDLKSFVVTRIGFLPHFQRDLPHLLRRFPPQGSSLQCDFLRRIAQVFPTRTTLNRGKTWCGYLLKNESIGVNAPWFGFVPLKRSREAPGERALLVLASDHEIDLDAEVFSPVSMDDPIYLRPPQSGRYFPAKLHWEARLDRHWGDPSFVRKALGPVFEVPAGKDGPQTS